MTIRTFFAVLGFLSLCTLAAQNVFADANFDKGVRKTQAELRDTQNRKKLVKTPEAKEADARVQELTSSKANQDAIYKLSADALGDMKGKSPEELMQLIAEAQKDPQAFFKKLPPATQKKIRELASQIEAEKAQRP